MAPKKKAADDDGKRQIRIDSFLKRPRDSEGAPTTKAPKPEAEVTLTGILSSRPQPTKPLLPSAASKGGEATTTPQSRPRDLIDVDVSEEPAQFLKRMDQPEDRSWPHPIGLAPGARQKQRDVPAASSLPQRATGTSEMFRRTTATSSSFVAMSSERTATFTAIQDERSWPSPIKPRDQAAGKAGGSASRESRGLAQEALPPGKAPPLPAICRHFIRPKGCTDPKCRFRHLNDFGHGVLRMPWSELFQFVSPSTGNLCSAWTRTSVLMKDRCNTILEFEEWLLTLPVAPSGKPGIFPRDFSGLLLLLNHDMPASEVDHFLRVVLPWMCQVVLDGPNLFPTGVPLLVRGTEGSVRLSQAQVCCLICCAFLGILPFRTKMAEASLSAEALTKDQLHYQKNMPFVNFSNLFAQQEPSARSKMRCFLSYFSTMQKEWSAVRSPSWKRQLEFVRVVPKKKRPPLESSPHALTKIEVKVTGLIEDAAGMAQADFANKVLGGGILGRGCVQEEIRFACCPELLVSRILAEPLDRTEAFLMNGAQAFCQTSGYASTFTYDGPLKLLPATSPHVDNILDVCVVAFDAINYNSTNLRPDYQYLASWIAADTTKALNAFAGSTLSTLPAATRGPIATGNWGCGAFAGDPELKLLIQLIAASVAGRPLTYFTFGNEVLKKDFEKLHSLITAKGVTAGELYSILLGYHSDCLCAAESESETEAEAEADALALIKTESILAGMEDPIVDDPTLLGVDSLSKAAGSPSPGSKTSKLKRQKTGFRSVFQYVSEKVSSSAAH
jgi:poly(ADP-ribose) glycohydrolase